MAIVFYISGHGFGHASRQVEIINALGALSPEPLVLRTAVSPDLLSRTIRVPYQLEPGPCDTGIIQTTSVHHDDPATVRAALAFYADYGARVEADVARLASRHVRLIVGDVPPLAFSVAARLGVPSVAISNFTWDWIYETHPGFLPAGAAALDLIRSAYRRADLALELPFAGGFEIFGHVEQLPLVARQATQTRAATRARFGWPAHGPVALLSFGGYGLPSLDLAALDCGDTWTIVTTDRVSSDARSAPHVRLVTEHQFVGSDFRYEDLVAASDVVITKPGYGITAECVSTGTAMLYTSRGHFREYDVLVSALSRLVRSRFISHDDLFGGRWLDALNAVRAQPAPAAAMRATGAAVAARRIVQVLTSSR